MGLAEIEAATGTKLVAGREYEWQATENMHALIVGSQAIEMVPKTSADAALAERDELIMRLAGEARDLAATLRADVATDNRIENLQLMTSGDHSSVHSRDRDEAGRFTREFPASTKPPRQEDP